MSASDKKKLRKEQNAAKMTERQRKEQAEAKKLKTTTTAFVLALVVILVTALGVLGYKTWVNKGFTERMTTAAVVEGKKLSTPVMSYYYNDAVNELYSEWASSGEDPTEYLLEILGLDVTKPLNEQKNPETDQLWSDYFLNEALDNAKSDYALYNKAKAEGFKLPEEKQTELDTMIDNMKMYAELYGFPGANDYISAIYGKGASLRSYRKYCERSYLADAYAEAHQESLVYSDEKLREYEADKFDDYSTYTYSNVYISINAFLGDDATDEEKEAARAKLIATAEELAATTDVDDLEEKLNAVEFVEGKKPTLHKKQRSLYPTLSATNADLAAWLSDDARTEGEIGSIEVAAKANETDAEETINGYYIVAFHEYNDNTKPMSNVRHLLVKFEGGEEDEETGDVNYTEEEKAAAREIAEGHLKTWKEGEATEQSFIDLILEHSQDNGVEENEGLYPDINSTSSYVDNFLEWSIDPNRKAGDTGVIETEYGYHVMYYVGDSDTSYRDQMITEELRAADQETWYNGIVDAATGNLKNTSKLTLDLILNPAQ